MLIGIARRPAHRAPMERVPAVRVCVDTGIEGDHKGAKFPERQVTLLDEAAWADAVRDAGAPSNLNWTARRANLLTRDVSLMLGPGSLITIGEGETSVELEVTFETVPCGRMNEAAPGLLKALAHKMRGGVTCRVVRGGEIRIDDHIRVSKVVPVFKPRLPG
ncbi:MAG: MOSC domain-containing protein [Pseudomonadota bacterium]